MKRLIFILAALAFATPALAQTAFPAKAVSTDGRGYTPTPVACLDTSGNAVWCAQPVSAATISTASTITTGGSYQTVLAATPGRLGCLIVNKSTSVMFVSLAATPTDAAAIRLAAGTATADGGSFSCGLAQGVVVSDKVSVKTATTGDAFLVMSQ